VTGPAGPQGAAGSAGESAVKIAEQSVCFDPNDDSGPKLCKIGMTGPGGGIVFFIDYFDQYPGFDYLELAPSEAFALTAPVTITNVTGNGSQVTYTASNAFAVGETVTVTGVNPASYNVENAIIISRTESQFTVENAAQEAFVSGGTAQALTMNHVWCSDTTTLQSTGLWEDNAVGLGSTLTHNALDACSSGAIHVAANYSNTFNGETFTDWFLPSFGEWMLVYTNLRQAGRGRLFHQESGDIGQYWSSTERSATQAWTKTSGGVDNVVFKSARHPLRAARAF
jgi:hypothetical protein